jgi:Glycosyl hydrolase family 79, N-terminal domain
MNRRGLIIGGAATCLLKRRTSWAFAEGDRKVAGTLSLDLSAPRVVIPGDFTGLSYESAQLANPGYFSRDNVKLVEVVRQLGARGVLRLGGSTSDYDQWKPEQSARRAGWNDPVNPDDGKDATVRGVVTETAIDELRGFLDATGWTAIYGLDLGHGSPEAAADEAAYIVQKLGSKLVALQIGNEPDLFSKDIRSSSYGYEEYFREWQSFANAIRRRVREAPLAGPDVSGEVSWVERFAQQARDICMLTSHYYAEGPPESPDSDIPHLLQRQDDLAKQMQQLVEIGRRAQVPYRMSEGNSCYNGGKAGVSDAFASALWGADFMLLLAQLGVAGINFHGGGRGYYTPIAGGGSAAYAVRPLYAAMLVWRAFASGAMIRCKLDAGGANATAYACIDAKRRLSVAIINKDLHRDLPVRLEGEGFRGPSQEMVLTAPSVESTSDVTLGGQRVFSGVWHPEWSQRSRRPELVVPRTSALLLQWEGVSL